VLVGKTPRDLTLDDALALKRSHAGAPHRPLIIGTGDVHVGSRVRETAGARIHLGREGDPRHGGALGRFLPEATRARSLPVCVIGAQVPRNSSARSGRWRMGAHRRPALPGDRIMARQGESLGFNTDEIVIVPLAAAQALFNTEACSASWLRPRAASRSLRQGRCRRDHPAAPRRRA